MTLNNDFASWKKKFVEATANIKRNPNDEAYVGHWSYQQGVASENMHKIANVLRTNPWTDDISTERARTGKAEEDIMKRWTNKTHPVVTEYDILQNSHEKALKELLKN